MAYFITRGTPDLHSEGVAVIAKDNERHSHG